MIAADPFEMTVPDQERRSAFDPAEARRALSLLLGDDHHELRGLPSGRSRIASGRGLDAAIESVAELADDRGVYVTLNPVDPGIGNRAARVADVRRRKHLLIDIDPVRTEPNATESEKAEAESVANAVWLDLSARGWPTPIIIDSGNGWHLIYRVDLPNDKLAQQILKACLETLAKAHDTAGAKIDRAVHNASRISKLPGTWARKGPATPERPHRLARLMLEPPGVVAVPFDMLRDLAGDAAATTNGHASRPDPFETTVPSPGDGRMDRYVRNAVELELARVALSTEGERNNALNRAAFAIGQLIAPGRLDRLEIEARLADAARRAGLAEHETAATIRSGLDAGAASPRVLPESLTSPNGKAKAKTTTPPGKLTIRASEVRPKAVRWLWHQRIPLHFVTVFAGRTGLGKSFVLCDLAARITTGRDLPDGPSDGQISNVLFISEDPYEYMLAPRLLELGADMARIHFLSWEAMASYTLENTEFLGRAWEEAGRPRLICIDPPTNFLGEADEHKNSEVRAILMKLVIWLDDHEAACVLITHVNKQTGKDVSAINRVIGSVAWTTTARVAHAFAPHDEHADQCLFVPIKSNLGKIPKGLAYRIAPTDSLAVVEWLGEHDATADEAMSGGGGRNGQARDVRAADWLLERFAEQTEWYSDDLFTRARAEGVSRNAVFEAKKKLRLPPAKPVVLPGGKRAWVWWIPPEFAPPAGGDDSRDSWDT